MEYASTLGTIIFDESCHLRDLTEAQVGRNQFAIDVAVDRLDGEADHAAERIGVLEDKEADMERSLNALLELGQEQTEASTRVAWGLGQLATCVLAQQNKIRAMEERIDVIITVVWHNFHSTLSLFLLSPTLHPYSLILSFSLSYLFTRHLSYLTHISSCSFSHVPYLSFKYAGYRYDVIQEQRTRGIYL